MNCTKKIQPKKDTFVIFNGLNIKKFTLSPEYRAIVKGNWKKYISSSGLKQGDIAKKLGKYDADISNLISGKGEMKVSDIEKLCELLNITPKEIFLS